MENRVDSSTLNEYNIYEGGTLSQINAEDLRDNVVGIKQLINNHLLVITQSKQKDLEIQEYKSTIEYLKTSPFVSIIASILNLCGSGLLAISVNLYTQESTPKYSWIILLIGFLLVLTGSLSTILYPYARKWFNKNAR